MMSMKNSLTNEELTNRFDNPFSLVNYAISLAKTRMERGEGLSDNLASDILEMIVGNRDLLIDEEDDEEEAEDETKE